MYLVPYTNTRALVTATDRQLIIPPGMTATDFVTGLFPGVPAPGPTSIGVFGDQVRWFLAEAFLDLLLSYGYKTAPLARFGIIPVNSEPNAPVIVSTALSTSPRNTITQVTVITGMEFLRSYNTLNKIVRMSIIPHTEISPRMIEANVKGNTVVMLGVKRKSGKLTDIGGGCKLKRELPLQCLGREIDEELGMSIDLTMLDWDKTRVVMLKQSDGMYYYAVIFTPVTTFEPFLTNFKPGELADVKFEPWVVTLARVNQDFEPYTTDFIIDKLRNYPLDYLV